MPHHWLSLPSYPHSGASKGGSGLCGISSMEVASENLMETEVMAPGEGKDFDQKV
jgi:hypothetical protein